MNITWNLRTFNELTTSELYTTLQLRQEIFVVEQNCPYLDCDNKDQKSYHLLGWDITSEQHKLIAYLRILPPTVHDNTCKIGRVLCHPARRRTGLGKELMRRGISSCNTLFPQQSIQISAQQYLLEFYTGLGFSISSDPYDEDGIPHIGMTYTNQQAVQSDTL
ncbi:GNAT family N-acetyltransferase [Desulforhopalus sp. 52FAK]